MSGASARSLPRLRYSLPGGATTGQRLTAAEAAVALVHDGATTAVMMATPADLEDFGLGFSLTEGIVETAAAVRDLEMVPAGPGIEVRMWLAADASARLAARRRRLAGATGCGLCGIESLAEAARAPRRVAGEAVVIEPAELARAMQAMADAQPLGRATRAVHAAALWRGGRIAALREDVGRHNALDKLAGAIARAGEAVDEAVILLTSRVSVEMVQKAAAIGAPILCAVSAPTTLAVETAEAAGMTLVAIARADGLEVFTRPERVRE